MKALKALTILLLAVFSYTAVSAQTTHRRWHKQHHRMVHRHRRM